MQNIVMDELYVTTLPLKMQKRIGKIMAINTPLGPSLDNEYLSVFDTLMRIPADIVLSVAARDLHLADRSQCLLGWTVREHFFKVAGIDPEDTDIVTNGFYQADVSKTGLTKVEKLLVASSSWDTDPATACQTLYGGELGMWEAIFFHVVDETGNTDEEYDYVTKELIEAAWTTRIQFAVDHGL